MDEENKSQKVQLEDAVQKESELQKEIKALLRKIDDLESKVGQTSSYIERQRSSLEVLI